MKSVFENAPDGVKTLMEKMPAKSIFLPNSFSDEQNNVWKNRLRDYIVKIRWESKAVLGNTSVTDPKEDETVLDYIRRIYPSVVRAEINEEVKH
jgi:hypothetical protein